MEDLKGKIVVVTGGSRGIGRACCLAFAKAGSNIVFTYNKSKTEAETLEKQIKNLGVDCLGMQIDVRDYNQCRKLIEKALENFKQIDVLINNAGIVRDRALLMMTIDDWKEVLDTNLGGTFNMTRAAITTFLKQKKGCIINMSSVSGLVGIPRQTNYCASKAGIIGFSMALAKEVAPYNIRVNVIAPGYVNTDILSSLKEELKKEIISNIPLKRLGEPEEVAHLCVCIASEKLGYLTGEVIKIDGALTA